MPTMCAATRVCTVPAGNRDCPVDGVLLCRAGGGGAELGGAPPTPRRRNAASTVRNPRGAASTSNTPANGTVNRAYPATVNTPNTPSTTTSTHHPRRAPAMRRILVRLTVTTLSMVGWYFPPAQVEGGFRAGGKRFRRRRPGPVPSGQRGWPTAARPVRSRTGAARRPRWNPPGEQRRCTTAPTPARPCRRATAGW